MRLASTLQSLPPILHIKAQCSCQAIVKVHGVFPSCRGYTASHSEFNFTESRVETAWPSLRLRAGRNLPDKEFRYLRTVIVRPPFTGASIKSFALPLTPSITFRHRAGVTPYTSTFVFAQSVFLINSCSQLVSSTDFSSIARDFTYISACLLPKLRHHFASSFTRVLSSALVFST